MMTEGHLVQNFTHSDYRSLYFTSTSMLWRMWKFTLHENFMLYDGSFGYL